MLGLTMPGRVCIMGEHSDWAGRYRIQNPCIQKGMALVARTNQRIYAQVEPHPTKLIMSSNSIDEDNSYTFDVEVNLEALDFVAHSKSHWRYICGVAAELIACNYPIAGLLICNLH